MKIIKSLIFTILPFMLFIMVYRLSFNLDPFFPTSNLIVIFEDFPNKEQFILALNNLGVAFENLSNFTNNIEIIPLIPGDALGINSLLMGLNIIITSVYELLFMFKEVYDLFVLFIEQLGFIVIWFVKSLKLLIM